MSKETKENKLYRKIWSTAYGPIPKDSYGRSFEIHHINGDHSDNSLPNLKLVTIDEHYDVHYSQGDLGACKLILQRMRLTPEEISLRCSQLNRELAAEGRHPSQLSSKNGTHQWQDSARQRQIAKNAIEKGTHVTCQEDWRDQCSIKALDRVASGTHNWQDGEASRQRALKAAEAGIHPSQTQVSCAACHKLTNIQQITRHNCVKL